MAKPSSEVVPTTLITSSSTTKIPSQTNVVTKRSVNGLKPSAKCSKKTCSEISFKDFLDFIQTAYQVNECVEGVVSNTEVDWKNIATNQLIASLLGMKDPELQKNIDHVNICTALEDAKKDIIEITQDNKYLSLKKAESTSLERKLNPIENANEPTTGKKLTDHKSVEQLLKKKLNEVIQEGLLDSVLPYVVPKQNLCPQPSIKKTVVENKPLVPVEKPPPPPPPPPPPQREKSNSATKRKASSGPAEVEVEIHVCDEVKNLKRDFKCSQKLLVSKMGYFAEVTTGQKLEDMDISVHCDITIFDWLMRWVKRDYHGAENWPTLDASNVVPILVSAAFLQMDPLLQDCLNFCREHMNEIVKTSTNLACLNDSILTRLANLFSNIEVENLRDRKDKIQSRLYCKLITSLTEITPESARGHFASLAAMYRCSKCERLVLRQLATHILCKPSCMRMDRFGNITAIHARDSNWNLNDYIRKLHEELKSWRSVYWRLWGDCHFLFCTTCHHYFPVHQIGWCCYHPEQPQFFTMENQRSTMYPIGRFPCCGERAYRFEVLRNQSGCQFREHTPSLTTEKEMAVHKVFSVHKNLISQVPPKLTFPERLTKLVSNRDVDRCHELNNQSNHETLWWEGMELAPPRPRLGLLGRLWDTQPKDTGPHSHHSLENLQSHQNKRTRNFKISSSTGSLTTASDSGISKQLLASNTICNYGQARKQLSPVTDMPVPCDPFSDVPSHFTSDDDSSSDGNISEESSGHIHNMKSTPRLRRPKPTNQHGKQRVDCCRQWLANLSIRSNQDNQREYEENLMRQMTQILTRRTCGRTPARMIRSSKGHGHGHGYYHSSIWNNHIIPIGGIYVRLEQEWKDAVSHGRTGQLSRQRSTNSLSARQKLRISR